jgi:hypothetical protein
MQLHGSQTEMGATLGMNGAPKAEIPQRDLTIYLLKEQIKEPELGGAHGIVEFCDLFAATKDLIHVRRYGASRTAANLVSPPYACLTFRAQELRHFALLCGYDGEKYRTAD